VFCCGGPDQEDHIILFYVPPNLRVAVGDIVELRSGKTLKKGSEKYCPPSTATKVRQTKESGNKKCRWVPDNPKLWRRVLYCDWMKKEGWVQQTGLFNVWVKLPN
jgi:hypothetical protein